MRAHYAAYREAPRSWPQIWAHLTHLAGENWMGAIVVRGAPLFLFVERPRAPQALSTLRSRFRRPSMTAKVIEFSIRAKASARAGCNPELNRLIAEYVAAKDEKAALERRQRSIAMKILDLIERERRRALI